MWSRPLFRNGVICGLAGVLLFRLSVAVIRYFYAASPKLLGGQHDGPAMIWGIFPLGFFLMALGGVIAIMVSLIIGDKTNRENSGL